MVLSLVALMLTRTARTGIAVADREARAATAEALADAGVHAGAARLLEPTDNGRVKVIDFAFALGSGEVVVHITSEAGRIDLNLAPLDQIAALLRVSGLADEEAQRLAGRLGDYRDPDDDRRTDGAELPEYRVAGLAHGPADGPLRDESELRLILGFPAGLYSQLRPFVTVFSGRERVDPEAASPEVLLTLPGMTLDRAERLSARAQTSPTMPSLAPVGSSGGASTYRIIATATLADGTRFVREAVLRLGQAAKPFGYLAWREGP